MSSTKFSREKPSTYDEAIEQNIILLVDGYVGHNDQQLNSIEKIKSTIIHFYAQSMRLKYNQKKGKILYLPPVSWSSMNVLISQCFTIPCEERVIKLSSKSQNISKDEWNANVILEANAIFEVHLETTLDLPSTDSLVERIDIVLSRYYRVLNTPYDKLFLTYCAQNGLDDEFVRDELDEQSAEDSLLPAFDDAFPFRITPKNQSEKKHKIMKIITDCVNNPGSYKREVVIAPSEKDHSYYEDDTKRRIQESERLLSTHCAGLFTTEYQNDARDTAYKRIKSIDVLKQQPIMLFFVDSFCRLRMDKHYYCKGDQKMDTWGLADFFDEYGDRIETLIESSQLQIANKLVTLDELSNGLKSFMNRVLPKMRISKPMTLICDDLNQYAMYLWGITNYLSVQKLEGIGDPKDNHPQSNGVPATMEKPLHIDFIIIPQCTQSVVPGGVYEEDSDDDDDDDDTLQQATSNNDLLLMGSGGNNRGQPMHPIGDVSTYLKRCEYKKNHDFWVKDIDTSSNAFYDDRVIKATLIGMHHKANVSNYERLIFIIDRRNPQALNKASFSLNNKVWHDKIYCIKPKKYKTMPFEFEYLPESLFCLSQNLMLPPNIGIKQDLNGYMFALSYHVYSSKIIRSYFCCGGQIQRFCIKDIALFWPNLFMKRDGSLQTIDVRLKRFVFNATYNDDLFANFTHHLEK